MFLEKFIPAARNTTQTPDPMCAKTRRPLRGLGERYHSGSDGPGKVVFSFPGLKAVEVPGMCL